MTHDELFEYESRMDKYYAFCRRDWNKFWLSTQDTCKSCGKPMANMDICIKDGIELERICQCEFRFSE